MIIGGQGIVGAIATNNELSSHGYSGCCYDSNESNTGFHATSAMRLKPARLG